MGIAHNNGEIRVGLVRCDRRALWYGAIFDEIDPLFLRSYDYDIFHHFTFYAYTDLRHRRAKGFRLTKVFDEDRKRAEDFSRAFSGRPQVCSNLAEVSDDVDLVFIANASGSGSDHLTLTAPGLRKGVATFVDRPFAGSTRDARAMIDLAEEHRTSVLSCSHMSLLPHAGRFKARFPEVGAVIRGVVVGHGPEMTTVADDIDLALHLFGSGVAYVESTGSHPLELLHLQYDNEETGHKLPVLVVNSHMRADHDAMFASAYGYAGQIHCEPMTAFTFPEGGLAVLNAIKEMIGTGTPPVPYGNMIESVRIAEMGREVHNQGRPGYVRQ